jgi:hypothetical protein
MIDDLKNILNTKCSTLSDWIKTFESFIDHQPRDTNSILNNYKHSPDYCTWELRHDSIITISYQYVHKLCSKGDMHCLQAFTNEKYQSLENYKKLKLSSNLPILEIASVNDNLLYTKFSSPTGDMGYPAPYMILNIMYHSKNVVEDFRKYITIIIDNYVNLTSACIQNNIPLYDPGRALTNHYFDNSFYFKDSIFYSKNKNLTTDDVANIIISNIDGFRRAKGIISAYQSRIDSQDETVNLIYDEIENLKNYTRKSCLSLKNANLS